jgi:hypothetical protein
MVVQATPRGLVGAVTQELIDVVVTDHRAQAV